MAKDKKKSKDEGAVELEDFAEYIKEIDEELIKQFEKNYHDPLFDIDGICGRCHCVVKKKVRSEHIKYHYDMNLSFFVLGSIVKTAIKLWEEADG